MPFVFTRSEMEHCASLPHPASGLCMAFCVKEAVFKALKQPYNYQDCELFTFGTVRAHELRLTPALIHEFGIISTHVHIVSVVPGEYMATVLLFGAGHG
jgi:phosphopantetheinyl transferase (holo-ACP synthase)